MGPVKIYDADWQLTSEPAEDLESRLYERGLVTMWGDDGRVTVAAPAGTAAEPPLELLSSVAPISADLSWMMWWTDDDVANAQFRLAVLVTGVVRNLVLPTPPDLGWMRRAYDAEQALRRLTNEQSS